MQKASHVSQVCRYEYRWMQVLWDIDRVHKRERAREDETQGHLFSFVQHVCYTRSEFLLLDSSGNAQYALVDRLVGSLSRRPKNP